MGHKNNIIYFGTALNSAPKQETGESVEFANWKGHDRTKGRHDLLAVNTSLNVSLGKVTISQVSTWHKEEEIQVTPILSVLIPYSS